MSSWEKLLSRLLSLDGDLRFEELKKILEKYGYHLDSINGSHHTCRKEGRPPITIPKHKPIKKVYIRLIRDLVESEEINENS